MGEAKAAARARRDLPLVAGRVLRISADGKEKTFFDPALSPRLGKAKMLRTLRMAPGQDGTLYLLVWAAWGDEDAETGERGQYIVSLDRKGEYRAELKLDYEALLVREFEVFGSGDFLLVGHPGGDLDRVRIAVLPAAGGELRDVPGWSSYSAAQAERPEARAGSILPSLMARGADGRIYLAEQDTRLDVVVVYAFEPSGIAGEVLRLKPMPKGRKLEGLKAAGGRLAATYSEPNPSDANGTRWWIATYDTALGSEMQSLFGPVSRRPSCYQREGSEDRFTLFGDGKLTMMAP